MMSGSRYVQTDDQQIPDVTHAQGHEARLVVSIAVVSCQREVIVQDRDRFSEGDPMGTEIRPSLRRVPFEPHASSV